MSLQKRLERKIPAVTINRRVIPARSGIENVLVEVECGGDTEEGFEPCIPAHVRLDDNAVPDVSALCGPAGKKYLITVGCGGLLDDLGSVRGLFKHCFTLSRLSLSAPGGDPAVDTLAGVSAVILEII